MLFLLLLDILRFPFLRKSEEEKRVTVIQSTDISSWVKNRFSATGSWASYDTNRNKKLEQTEVDKLAKYYAQTTTTDKASAFLAQYTLDNYLDIALADGDDTHISDYDIRSHFRNGFASEEANHGFAAAFAQDKLKQFDDITHQASAPTALRSTVRDQEVTIEELKYCAQFLQSHPSDTLEYRMQLGTVNALRSAYTDVVGLDSNTATLSKADLEATPQNVQLVSYPLVREPDPTSGKGSFDMQTLLMLIMMMFSGRR